MVPHQKPRGPRPGRPAKAILSDESESSVSHPDGRESQIFTDSEVNIQRKAKQKSIISNIACCEAIKRGCFYLLFHIQLTLISPFLQKKRLISVSSQYPNNKRIHIITFISNILYTTG